MKLLLLVFCFTTILINCSTPEKTAKKAPAVKFKHSTSGPKQNKNKGAISSPKVTKGKYNIGDEIKKILPENWEKEFWFESIDNKNGFARMGGYMEGHIDYYLFVGKESNLLVEVSWGCGPACEQVIKFYKNIGKTYKAVTFEKLLSSEDLKALGNQIEICSSSKSFNSWSNQKCSIMLDFPETGTGTVAKVFKAQFFDDDKFQDSYGRKGKKIAEFNWDKRNFKFVKKK